MRALPFDDASIDVVVSSLAIHNVPSAAQVDLMNVHPTSCARSVA